MQLHYAALMAGDDQALLIAEACKRSDVVITRYPKAWDSIAVGETMAIKTIGSCIKKFGMDTTVTALRCVRDSGDGNAGALGGPVIYGIAEVLFDHSEWREAGGVLLAAFDEIDVGDMYDKAKLTAAGRRGTSAIEQFEALLVGALARAFKPKKSESNSTNPAPSPSVSNSPSTQMLSRNLGLIGEGDGAGPSLRGDRK